MTSQGADWWSCPCLRGAQGFEGFEARNGGVDSEGGVPVRFGVQKLFSSECSSKRSNVCGACNDFADRNIGSYLYVALCCRFFRSVGVPGGSTWIRNVERMVYVNDIYSTILIPVKHIPPGKLT